jgi:hypothetical protein
LAATNARSHSNLHQCRHCTALANREEVPQQAEHQGEAAADSNASQHAQHEKLPQLRHLQGEHSICNHLHTFSTKAMREAATNSNASTIIHAHITATRVAGGCDAAKQQLAALLSSCIKTEKPQVVPLAAATFNAQINCSLLMSRCSSCSLTQ